MFVAKLSLKFPFPQALLVARVVLSIQSAGAKSALLMFAVFASILFFNHKVNVLVLVASLFFKFILMMVKCKMFVN